MNDGFLESLRRPRRNRSSEVLRKLLCETTLSPSDFILPLFIREGTNEKTPIESMEGVYRFSIDQALKTIEKALSLGILAYNIFCYTEKEKKDLVGSEALRENNLLQRSIRAIKKEFPHSILMADIALDPFTLHGHDGIVENDIIVNDPTVVVLTKMALLAAASGCDVVSPSDMMDSRVRHIRSTLDSQGFSNVLICSYAAKYASALYGPFRSALDSRPTFGDKKTYQMDPANIREAVLECLLDEEEGADMLLIKPAITNLDVIAKVKERVKIPVGAYQVSGEYTMIKEASKKGCLDGMRVLMEMLLSIKRAGASFIFSYAAVEAAQFLKDQG